VAAVVAETEPEYVPQIEYVLASELRTGVIQPMPELKPEELAALRADIAERGVQVPVDVIHEVGYWLVVDGNNRASIAAELLQKVPIRPVPGLTMSDAIDYALRVNVARRHLTSKQKRELIAAELRHDRSRSDAAIARLLGVSDKTVAAVRGKNLGNSEVSKSAGGRPHRDGTPARRTERSPAAPRHQIRRSGATPSDTPVVPEQRRAPLDIELQALRAERDDLRAWQAGAAETETAFEATIADLEQARQRISELERDVTTLEDENRAHVEALAGTRTRIGQQEAEIDALHRAISDLNGELRTARELATDAMAASPTGPAELTEALQVIEELRDSLATMTGRYEAFAAADADSPDNEPARGYRRLAMDMADWLDLVHPDWQTAIKTRHQPDRDAPPAAAAHDDQHGQRRRWRRS